MYKLTFVCFLFLFSQPCWAQHFSFDQLLSTHPELKEFLNDSTYQTQLIYTQINRDEQNKPHFKSFTHNVDDGVYFYPASTVKMPTAFLALQRLNELNIDKHVHMRTGANRFIQTSVNIDTSSVTQKPSIAHYIKKIFLVSDNDAFNRLYEFLGQDYINTQLHQKGYKSSRIKHRLAVTGYSAEENQFVNPIWLYSDEGNILYERPGINAGFPFKPMQKRNMKNGKGYWSDAQEKVILEPFDFTQKNFISLQDLHDILKAVMFPEAIPACERFMLTESDYKFLRKWMSTLPTHSESPLYKERDNYTKFILFGDEEDDFSIPDHIKVFNKAGWAYGFLTDVVYVADNKNNVEFILAAQMLVNENEIFNDGKYQMMSKGVPFYGKLGKAIYEYERHRKKTYTPNLSKFFSE